MAAVLERAYRNSTRAFGVLMVLLGMVMIVSTIVRGGGAFAFGIVLGVAFTLLGAGRLYLARGQ
jgi:hypothetical protein